MVRPANPAYEVVLAHSSDLHVDEDRAAADGGEGTSALCSVLGTAQALRADILLLAGDTFENNQLGAASSIAPSVCSPKPISRL